MHSFLCSLVIHLLPHFCILKIGALNVGTSKCKSGANEIAELLEQKFVNVWCVQEVKWKGASVKFLTGKEHKYKSFGKALVMEESDMDIL